MAKIRRQNAPRRLQDAILVGFWSQNEAELSQVGKDRMRKRSCYNGVETKNYYFSDVIKLYWKSSIFLLPGYFNIRSLPRAIFIPTWVHFGSKNLPKSRLGGV